MEYASTRKLECFTMRGNDSSKDTRIVEAQQERSSPNRDFRDRLAPNREFRGRFTHIPSSSPNREFRDRFLPAFVSDSR